VSSHVLSEAQQTVDDVVVIARGRLVRQGSLAELETGPTAVLVRTPTPEQLREALASYSVTEVDGRLRVEGSTTDQVGHLAHTHGVELHELTAEASDLEKIFLSMTTQQTDEGSGS
jgi:ABC-2 type transport system ATP-binding protein